MTDLTMVVAQLKQERDKLDQAIAALSGVGRAGRTGKRRVSAANRGHLPQWGSLYR
jgi:hypothetical protein